MVLAAIIYPDVIIILSALACISGIWYKSSISRQGSLRAARKNGHEARSDPSMFIFAEIYTHYGSFKVQRIH